MVVRGLAAGLMGLAPSLAAGGRPALASPGATKVEGTLAGSTGGSFATYDLAYPGDGSPVELTLYLWTADANVIRGTGLNVYGPTPGKTYASSAADGGQERRVGFASGEPGQYVVQVYNYTPQATGFTLVASHGLATAAGGGAGRTIVLDPGHGGPEIGAVTPGSDLLEKNVNLRIALKLADMLRGQGHRVVLTRDTDRSVKPGYRSVDEDLQARIDIANAANADVFICIHNNGGPASESGTEVWYNRGRPFAERNVTLARLVQSKLVDQIRALGYPVRDRGIKDDARFRVSGGRTYNLYVLGPGTSPRPHTPTKMPGVLGESLFMSHPGDAAMLRQERTLDAIARGYRDAIGEYFRAYPS